MTFIKTMANDYKEKFKYSSEISESFFREALLQQQQRNYAMGILFFFNNVFSASTNFL